MKELASVRGPLVAIEVSEKGAQMVAEEAIANSKWFEVLPLPFNNYEITMKLENKAWLEWFEQRYPARDTTPYTPTD